MLDFDLLKDCYGCGACVNVCPRGAVHMTQAADGSYIPEIDEARCIGCGKCAKECPRAVISIHDRLNPIVVKCSNHDAGKAARQMCEVSCIGCGLCAKACPASAITVKENLSEIDESLCLSCGQCAVKCPRHAIVDMRGILTPKCW